MNTNTQRYSEVDLFSTEGRIGQKLYFFYSTVVPFLFFWIFASVAGIISKLGSDVNVISYGLLGMAILTVFFMMVRLSIQRCHDFDKSGWFAVLALIPFANIIFSLIPGDSGLNRYGEPPKPDSSFIKSAVFVLTLLLFAIAIFALLYFLDINVRDFI